MNLPDPKQLQDAQWQLDHASEKLAPFLQRLQQLTETEPTDPAQRARHEQTTALLRALNWYFERTDALIQLLTDREDEMQREMSAAQFKYTAMVAERDWLKVECQELGPRYYAENDLMREILERFKTRANAA